MENKSEMLVIKTIVNNLSDLDTTLSQDEQRLDNQLKMIDNSINEIVKVEGDLSKEVADVKKHLDKLYDSLLSYDSVDSSAERYLMKRKAIKEIKEVLYDLYVISENKK